MVKRVSVERELIQELKKSSEEKYFASNCLPTNEVMIRSKIILFYDAIRELLEALVLVNGFKIYNHECYGFFLRDVLKEQELGEDFNELRKLRNAINYYGRRVTVEDGQAFLDRMQVMLHRVKKLFEFSI